MGGVTAKIGAPEFERLFNFLDSLQESGYTIGTRQIMALNDLLLMLVAQGETFDDFGFLKTLIAPLICTTPAEQNDFYRRFDHWNRLFQPEKSFKTILPSEGLPEPEKISPPTPLASPLPHPLSDSQPPIGKFSIRLGIISMVAVALVSFAIWLFQATQIIPILFYIPANGLIFVSIVFLVASLLGWRFWNLYQENQFVTRELAEQTSDDIEIPVKAYIQKIFPELSFKPVSSALRRRAQTPSVDVDIEKTIENVLSRGTWWEVVYRQRHITPEYVVLLDRKSQSDQQTYFVHEILKQLQNEGVFLYLYEFNGDPSICFPFDHKNTPLYLRELQARHPNLRLLVFSGTSELINPLNGQLRTWLDALLHWRERAILTPGNVQKYLLEALHAQDFVILPITLGGLTSMVHAFETNSKPAFRNGEPHLPAALIERPRRWAGRDAIPEIEVQAMLAELKTYLGEHGFYWLCACATYPELSWKVTLYSGSKLKDNAGQPLIRANILLRIARLPWFRTGYMPDWMRLALIDCFSTDQEACVRNALGELLSDAYKGNDFAQRFTKNKKISLSERLKLFAAALVRNSAQDSHLRDSIFVKFLFNQSRRKLSIPVPNRPNLLNDLPAPAGDITKPAVQPNLDAQKRAKPAERYQPDTAIVNPRPTSNYGGGGGGGMVLIDGGIVHYVAVGRGRPVVFLHGWLGSWRYWMPSMQYLTASTFRSYGLDFWGFGESARETTRYSIESQTALLDQFLQEMGIGKVALVGHGLGAVVGLSYALSHPNVVDRIMAVSAPLDLNSVNDRLRKGNIPDLVDWLVIRDPTTEPVRTDARKADPRALTTSFRSAKSFDLAGSIASLQTTCLLVYGQNDPTLTVPSFFDLPYMMQTAIMDQTGHFPMLDDPLLFNRLLSKFMALESGDSARNIGDKL